MYKDFQDSIKARLYDFKYTPFLASYCFFWIFFNAKLLLIFFDDKLSVQNKIDMMSYSDVNIFLPLWGALFYTLLFPLFNEGFYFVTLLYRKRKIKVQQEIEDITPLTQEEANKIKKENFNLDLELNKKIDELNDIKERIKNKEKDLEKREQELLEEYDTKIIENTEDLTKKLNEANKNIADKENIINKLRKEKIGLNEKINDLTNKLKYFEDKEKNIPRLDLDNASESIQIEDKNIDITKDERKLLQIIYENNISRSLFNTYIDNILKVNIFARVKIESLLLSLTKKNILSFDGYYYDTTEIGKKVILKLFDNK